MPDLVGALSTTGGFTYQPVTGEQPVSGYAVAIFPECERRYSLDALTPESLQSALVGYAREHAALLNRPNCYFGGWLDTSSGMLYLDVSIIVGTEREAIDIARRHKQAAYYDLARRETVVIAPDIPPAAEAANA